MKKLTIALAITSALGLTACDDTTLEDVQAENATLRAELLAESAATVAENATRARVVFDPANSLLSVPNDLLFTGTSDFTLEMPAEVAKKMAGEEVDWTNPAAVLGALDGWGTQNSFLIQLEYDAGVTLEASSLANPDAVGMYRVTSYPLVGDEMCGDTAKAGLLCRGEEKLTYGVDYVTSLVGGHIAIVPLKPLKAGASYAVTLTKHIKDSNGRDLLPSSTYESMEADIITSPIVSNTASDEDLNDTQIAIRSLQRLINSYEGVLAQSFEIDRDDVVYTQVFTTQSAGVPSTDPLQIAKVLNAQAFSALPDEQKATFVSPVMVGERQMTAADALASVGAISPEPSDSTNLLFQTALVHNASITLPYYLDDESGSPLTGRWEAACDSGVILSQMTAEQLGAAAANAGDNHELCAKFGLADLNVDTQRHLTKYNPIAKVKSMQSVAVQVTTPDLAKVNMILGAQGADPIAKGENGWPVVILQHGITSKKEDMFAITGALSMAGFATVAIDHPLHGSRGFTLTSKDSEGNDVTTIVNTTREMGGSTTDYLNLASVLTARDNLRQSAADGMQLRLLLNGFMTASDLAGDPTFDESNVHYLGHSLGAITGTTMTAVANSPVSLPAQEGVTPEQKAAMEDQIESAYAIKSALLANPGSSIANFLAESGSFGDLVQASVVYGLGNELTEALTAYMQPAAFTQILAANPTICGPAINSETGAIVDQTLALVCAYQAFKQEATPEIQAGIASAISQFAFAAQGALEAGDPSNYSQLLKATNTPVLVYEVVGDGDTSLPDQVIPNTVSTDVGKKIAGTTGLWEQLGLQPVTSTSSGLETGTAVSGVVRFTNGTHSSLLSPEQDDDSAAIAPNLLKNAAVNQEMQSIAVNYFGSGSKLIKLSSAININVPGVGVIPVTCVVENAAGCTEE